MSSRIRSRSLCSRLSRQGFPCSWCGLGAVLLFVMAYPPVAETSSEEIPVLFSTTSQEHTPFTFLQESGQNHEPCSGKPSEPGPYCGRLFIGYHDCPPPICSKGTSPSKRYFFNDTAAAEIYSLSLHDALPISLGLHHYEICVVD